MIIQGAAGSGKTSIALHRMAFMLYRFKHTIQSSDMLILSPNKVFGNYISNVLPELGEDHIQEIGFEEIASEILGEKIKCQTFAEQVSYLLETDDFEMKKRIEYKASVSFYIDLREYLSNYEQKYFKAQDIRIQGVKLSAEKIESFLRSFPNMPLKDKMEKMVKFKELEDKVLSVLSQLENNNDILKRANNSEKETESFQKELNSLKEENARLKNKLRDSQANNLNLNEEVKRLKVVNAMSGSQEYKQMMKQRMNKLIKEVDSCIAQIKTNN